MSRFGAWQEPEDQARTASGASALPPDGEPLFGFDLYLAGVAVQIDVRRSGGLTGTAP